NKAKLSMFSKRIQYPFSRDEKELLFRNKCCTFIGESILEIIFFKWEKIKTMEKLISYSSLCNDFWSGNCYA
ncbi:MAG: hypothetical protein COW63_19175, partial [Bacteroidetes bacterium CG18_big_fil_WC_8_21_14_2_50_41_14]